jgi:dimethylhistidine N-methyltransferase
MSSAAFAYSQTPFRKSSPAYDSEFAVDMLAGLRAQPKQLPCKYFYDEEGSRLFDAICELPEYYPTRTEIKLLKQYAPQMARLIGDAELIEFGAGSLQKVGYLLDAQPNLRAYVPIDISGDHLRTTSAKLAQLYPAMPIRPVVEDFTKPFRLESGGSARRVGFFPGSTIGNFDRSEACAFLRRAAKLLKGGGLLIGVDLVKDPAILHAAYNDSARITERFNKNILVRANRDLDATFDPDAFAHYAFYNPLPQRIEMHLVSLTRQTARIAGQVVSFAEGESVHTENSHKYTMDGFRSLASDAGFTPRTSWCDSDRLFSVHWLEA